MTKKMLYRTKQEESEKNGFPIRWKEHADFLMLENKPYTGEGILINSGEWNGILVPKEKNRIIEMIEKKKIGKRETNYHLRDWLISRQRYWGAPIPMIFCERCAQEG